MSAPHGAPAAAVAALHTHDRNKFAAALHARDLATNAAESDNSQHHQSVASSSPSQPMHTAPPASVAALHSHDRAAFAAAMGAQSTAAPSAAVIAEVAAAGDAALYSGVLFKQSDHWKSWNKRFLELHSTFIRYWDGETNAGSPRGMIDLKSAVSVQSAPSSDGAFPLTIWCRERTWELRAQTQAECDAWVAALGAVISAQPNSASVAPFTVRTEAWVQKKHGMFVRSWHQCWAVVGADAVYFFETVALARQFCSASPRLHANAPLPLLEALTLDHFCLKTATLSAVPEIDGLPFGIECFVPARSRKPFELVAKNADEQRAFTVALSQAALESGVTVPAADAQRAPLVRAAPHVAPALAGAVAALHGHDRQAIAAAFRNSLPNNASASLPIVGAKFRVRASYFSGVLFKRGASRAALAAAAWQAGSIVIAFDSLAVFADASSAAAGERELSERAALRYADTPAQNLQVVNATLPGLVCFLSLRACTQCAAPVDAERPTRIAFELVWPYRQTAASSDDGAALAIELTVGGASAADADACVAHVRDACEAAADCVSADDVALHDAKVARCARLRGHVERAKSAVRACVAQLNAMHTSLLLNIVNDNEAMFESTTTRAVLFVKDRALVFDCAALERHNLELPLPTDAARRAHDALVTEFTFKRFEAKRADGVKVNLVATDGTLYKCRAHSVADAHSLGAYVQRYASMQFERVPALADQAAHESALLEGVQQRWLDKQFTLAAEEEAEHREQAERASSLAQLHGDGEVVEAATVETSNKATMTSPQPVAGAAASSAMSPVARVRRASAASFCETDVADLAGAFAVAAAAASAAAAAAAASSEAAAALQVAAAAASSASASTRPPVAATSTTAADDALLAMPMHEYESGLLGARVDAHFMFVFHQTRVYRTAYTFGAEQKMRTPRALLPCDPVADAERFAKEAPLVLQSLHLKHSGSNKLIGIDASGLQRKFAAADAASAQQACAHIAKWAVSA